MVVVVVVVVVVVTRSPGWLLPAGMALVVGHCLVSLKVFLVPVLVLVGVGVC
jgi:hypothetical protein